jgi:hypothetical protein
MHRADDIRKLVDMRGQSATKPMPFAESSELARQGEEAHEREGISTTMIDPDQMRSLIAQATPPAVQVRPAARRHSLARRMFGGLLVLVLAGGVFAATAWLAFHA